ncbi:MAG: hypothetical protein ACYDCD_01755 [Candidatus Acidiferrales bacterium]
MRKLWRGIVNTLFWSYERGSWPYDVMVILIVIFVLLTPARWFHDQPQNNAATGSGIVFISEDQKTHTETFRIDPQLFAASSQSPHQAKEKGPQLERKTHQLLNGTVPEPFQVRSITPIRATDNSILYYQVEVKR